MSFSKMSAILQDIDYRGRPKYEMEDSDEDRYSDCTGSYIKTD